MNILMFLAGSFPHDRREEREIVALNRAGHTLSMLCRGKQNELFLWDKPDEAIRQMKVIRRHTPYYNLHALKCFSTNFVHDFWMRHLEEQIPAHHIDVLHVHNLGYAKTGILAAKQFGIPVVIDLHENAPAQMKDKMWKQKSIRWNPLSYVLYNVKRWERYQTWCMQQADRVIVVVEENRQHCIQEHGADPEKVEVLMNVEDTEYFANLPYKQEVIQKYQGKFVLSYVGGLGMHRGIDTLIHAFPKLKAQVPNAHLVIVGRGDREYTEYIHSLPAQLGITDAVEFINRVPFEEIASYIQVSDIGIVPHVKGSFTDTTLPNKPFQYMILGKPVIVSNIAPVKRITEETNCGLVFRSEDAVDLARVMCELATNPQRMQQLGQNGVKASREKYDWAVEQQKLVTLYENLAESRKSRNSG